MLPPALRLLPRHDLILSMPYITEIEMALRHITAMLRRLMLIFDISYTLFTVNIYHRRFFLRYACHDIAPRLFPVMLYASMPTLITLRLLCLILLPMIATMPSLFFFRRLHVYDVVIFLRAIDAITLDISLLRSRLYTPLRHCKRDALLPRRPPRA